MSMHTASPRPGTSPFAIATATIARRCNHLAAVAWTVVMRLLEILTP